MECTFCLFTTNIFQFDSTLCLQATALICQLLFILRRQTLKQKRYIHPALLSKRLHYVKKGNAHMKNNGMLSFSICEQPLS